MTRLEELISKGPVEWRTLGEVADVTKLSGREFDKHMQYSDTGTIIALRALNVRGWLDLSQVKYIDGSNLAKLSRSKLRRNDLLLTYIGYNTGQVALVDCDDRYYLGPNVCRIRFTEAVEPRFALHYFQTTLFRALNFKHHLRQSTMKNLIMGGVRCFMIPLPPLAVQREIADVLDAFSDLEFALKAELEARQKQYEYYRKQLLLFGPDEVEWATLGDIGLIRTCWRVFRKETSPSGEVPFYKIGTLGRKADAYISRSLYEEYRQRYPHPRRGEVLLSVAGTIGRVLVYDGEPAYFQDSNVVWISNDESRVLNRFLYYYYQVARWKVDDGGIIVRLYNRRLSVFPVPIPPKAVQREVVRMLDVFTEGEATLRAELEARRKQYAYYRERLMSFPRPEGGAEG